MSEMRMEGRCGYTIYGPQADAFELPIRISKSLSVRREPKLSGNNLRILYQNPIPIPNHRSSISSSDNAVLGPTTPVLPPTPPNVDGDSQEHTEEPSPVSDVTKIRSILATPVHQMSPPTPDNTPPREQPRMLHLLDPRPSMSSTRAESFKTAQEDLPSDKESMSSAPFTRPLRNNSSPALLPILMNGIHRPSPLANAHSNDRGIDSKDSSPVLPSSAAVPSLPDLVAPAHDFAPQNDHDTVVDRDVDAQQNIDRTDCPSEHSHTIQEPQQIIVSRKEGARRGPSLRDRLEGSNRVPHSPSMDKFASIIGWNNSVPNPSDDNRRWSGISTTSTVEAYLVEQPRIAKKRNTLRHMSKNESLRSVSSPLPKSNRNSLQSTSDSPHRLIHKKARLTNHHRLSFGSGKSRSVSTGSNPPAKVEVIRVAVIPERSSSLQRSTSSSRRYSHSGSGAPSSFRMPKAADNRQRKRSATDTTERGRTRHYPPQVPTRGSSLSAPTSRNTSRANSVTSDQASVERKRAEKDLRSTLDKMETERLATSLNSVLLETTPIAPPVQVVGHDNQGSSLMNDAELPMEYATPGTKEWADLRPPSMLNTPFSQPSFVSASPEISEARLIHVSVHNSHSVQLIEPLPISESRAVREVRKHQPKDEMAMSNTASPLRNPRAPPAPPQLHFVPPSPQDEEHSPIRDTTIHEHQSVAPPRPPIPTHTDSFAKALLRNVSLKNARNKTADQTLDASLHPFWRPRPFWENIDPPSPEKDTGAGHERGLVSNSLGLPHERLVIAGPLGLVRRFSERRRNRKVIAKQASYNSLHRLRTARRMHRIPGLGLNLQIMSFKDVQEKVHAVRQRREHEKLEKRREELRKRIGANIVPTGDSRFPTNKLDTGTGSLE